MNRQLNDLMNQHLFIRDIRENGKERKRGRGRGRWSLAALAFLVCLLLTAVSDAEVWMTFSVPVYADALQDVSIPVSQKLYETDSAGTGSASAMSDQEAAEITVYYRLTAEGEAPMPGGTKGGEYGFSMTGNTSDAIAITYEYVGEYHYLLERVSADGMEEGSYLSSLQSAAIAVYVTETESGSEEKVLAYVIEPAQDAEKKTDLEFTYTWERPAVTPTVTPTPTATPTPTMTPTPTVTSKPTATPAPTATQKASSGTSSSTTTKSASATSTTSTAVKTGDNTVILPYVILFALAGAVLVILLITRYRRRDY